MNNTYPLNRKSPTACQRLDSNSLKSFSNFSLYEIPKNRKSPTPATTKWISLDDAVVALMWGLAIAVVAIDLYVMARNGGLVD